MPEDALVREATPRALNEDLDRTCGKDDEAPEDRRVHDPGDGLAQDFRLRDADLEHVREPSPGSVGSVFGDAELEIGNEPLDVQREDSSGDGEDEEEDDALGAH